MQQNCLSPRDSLTETVAGNSGFWQPPTTPIALMDIHGTNDSTIPANVSNGFQYPKYTAPHGATFSDDGFFCEPPFNPLYCIIGDMTVRLRPRRYSQFEDSLRRGKTQRL